MKKICLYLVLIISCISFMMLSSFGGGGGGGNAKPNPNKTKEKFISCSIGQVKHINSSCYKAGEVRSHYPKYYQNQHRMCILGGDAAIGYVRGIADSGKKYKSATTAEKNEINACVAAYIYAACNCMSHMP